MKAELHLEAFKERKDTILKWALEVRGLEKSQRIIGDNASKAIVELLSAYLHRERKITEGFQINHTWFKSEKVAEKLPEFKGKGKLTPKMVRLEKLCERLSYGAPKPLETVKGTVKLFEKLEVMIKELMK